MFHPPQGEHRKHAYHTILEQKIVEALTPFQGYIKSQSIASILLCLCAAIALIWASVPSLSKSYSYFVNLPIGFHISNFVVKKPLQFWVNDFLLALFFFFVGLGIKREFLVGELKNKRHTIFLLFATFGGMLLPAALYSFINMNTPTQQGWGIPMATDTAFALGILSYFRKKIPRGMFTFLAALAILDDIGSIFVIAIFYTEHFSAMMLFIGLMLCGSLLFINYAGLRSSFPYIVIGLLIWLFFEMAGIHGTVAGIMVAFLIPARPQKGPRYLLDTIRALLSSFENRKYDKPLVLQDNKQHNLLEEIQRVAKQSTTPLQRWGKRLELPIAMIVLPLFALVNAGIAIHIDLLRDVLTQRVSLGILLGLLIGKPVGILLFSRLSLWLKWGALPDTMRWHDMTGIAMLTGIGFTMSVFIASLAFESQSDLLILSKAAILISSLVCGVAGMVFLSMSCRKIK